jgi:hypothetical protein
MFGKDRRSKLVGIGHTDDNFVAMSISRQMRSIVLEDRGICLRKHRSAVICMAHIKRKCFSCGHDNQITPYLFRIEHNMQMRAQAGISIHQVHSKARQMFPACSFWVARQDEMPSSVKQPFRDDQLREHPSNSPSCANYSYIHKNFLFLRLFCLHRASKHKRHKPLAALHVDLCLHQEHQERGSRASPALTRYFRCG